MKKFILFGFVAGGGASTDFFVGFGLLTAPLEVDRVIHGDGDGQGFLVFQT